MTVETKDLKAIERLSERLATAMNNGDISSVDDLALANAVLLAPARNLLRGAKDVVGAWRAMALRYSSIRFLPTVMEPLGPDVLLEAGMFTARPNRPDAERVSFKYQFVWCKRESDWKMASMTWNRTAPDPVKTEAKPGSAM